MRLSSLACGSGKALGPEQASHRYIYKRPTALTHVVVCILDTARPVKVPSCFITNVIADHTRPERISILLVAQSIYRHPMMDSNAFRPFLQQRGRPSRDERFSIEGEGGPSARRSDCGRLSRNAAAAHGHHAFALSYALAKARLARMADSLISSNLTSTQSTPEKLCQGIRRSCASTK